VTLIRYFNNVNQHAERAKYTLSILFNGDNEPLTL